MLISPEIFMAERLANAVARKTAMLMPKITCVKLMLDSPRRTQGCRITGCRFSTISPRCAASCCTHHWQIFLNESGGSCRPHRMQFAMSSVESLSVVGEVVGALASHRGGGRMRPPLQEH